MSDVTKVNQVEKGDRIGVDRGGTTVEAVNKVQGGGKKEDEKKDRKKEEDNTMAYSRRHENIRGNSEMMSMKYMHKPSRSLELMEKAEDPTAANSYHNAHLCDREHEEEIHDGCLLPSSGEELEHGGYKLVRKKSGEIVKPSLKLSTGKDYFLKKRSQSLPNTPSCKLVHFGDDTDVKFFRKKDKPTAISATNSPSFECVDAFYDGIQDHDDDMARLLYDTDVESSDNDNLKNMDKIGSTKYPRPLKEKKVEWKLTLLNFPNLSYDKKIKIDNAFVFLERIFVSMDRIYLIGHVAVKNIAYEKYVSVRYTLDNWKTIVEIPATYVSDTPSILKDNGYNRFVFEIPLESIFNTFGARSVVSSDQRAQEKSYSLCIKYRTNNCDFWDNNNWRNYNLKLKKTTIYLSGPLKISLHSDRPKYSSSYMKKHPKDTLSKDNEYEKYSQSESTGNDFLENAYYLLSPLLSSLTSRVKPSTDVKKENLSPLNNRATEDTDSAGNLEKQGGRHFTSDNPVKKIDYRHSPRRNVVDSKSYKELLDNYCFFSGPKTDSSQEDNYCPPFGDMYFDSLDLNSSPANFNSEDGKFSNSNDRSPNKDKSSTDRKSPSSQTNKGLQDCTDDSKILDKMDTASTSTISSFLKI